MRTSGSVVAVDLGATSGRVAIGRVADGSVSLETVARFPNQPTERAGGLHWDIDGLYRAIVAGLSRALELAPDAVSVGVDSWGCDYGLLRDGQLLGPPFHYRDDRTAKGVDLAHRAIGQRELYERNGLQFLPFNTVYQLCAEAVDGSLLDQADAMLLVPDLIAYWLSGEEAAEATNASTTGLLDVRTHAWDLALMQRLDLPAGVLPSLAQPGDVRGALRAASGVEAARAGRIAVTAVGSHDTASAVVATPMTTPDAAYISCGTWGLVGVELESPVLTEDSRAANFTNEGGVDGRVRFLHNVMGLWLLSESLRTWGVDAGALGDLLSAAADARDDDVAVFDANDARFMAPGDIPSRIAAYCHERGLPAPDGRAAVVRSIVESLAAAFASAVDTASALSGKEVDVVHIVGGGAQNALLCQLTADRSGRPVVAGPVEATALGNVLVQARAHGLLEGDLESLRSVVAGSSDLVRYEPRAGRRR